MTTKKNIPVVGMACASCAANVERCLNGLDGVEQASVNLAARSALVDYDPDKVTPAQMKKAVNGIGYDLVVEPGRSAETIQRRAYSLLRRHAALSWILAVAVMAISMGWINLGSKAVNLQTSMLLALANLLICGRQFYSTAWKQLKHGSANMDTLVALSTVISFLFSVFFSVEVLQDGKERKLCVFRLRLDVPSSVVSCDREVSEANLKLADPATFNPVILARLSVNLRAVGECLVLDLDASFVPHGFFLLVLFLFAFSFGMYIYHSARLI